MTEEFELKPWIKTLLAIISAGVLLWLSAAGAPWFVALCHILSIAICSSFYHWGVYLLCASLAESKQVDSKSDYKMNALVGLIITAIGGFSMLASFLGYDMNDNGRYISNALYIDRWQFAIGFLIGSIPVLYKTGLVLKKSKKNI